jgi:large subunit ribosomal protein L33
MAKSKGTRFNYFRMYECRSNLNKRSEGVSRYSTQKNRRNNPERIELKNIAHIATNQLYTKKLNKLWYQNNKKHHRLV